MKKLLVLVMAIVLAFGAVGCGDKSETIGEGEMTLKLGIPNGDTMTPLAILETFKKENPNIKVETDETPWSDFNTKLNMQISAGNAPDVFITDSGYAATLGGKGAAMNLAEKVEKDLNKDDFISAVTAIKGANGEVWSITHSLASEGVYYNKAIFDEYGVAYPEEDWTFEDMMEIAKKLTIDKDGDGTVDIYGLTSGSNITTGWLPYILAEGGAPLNEDKTESMFTDPKTIAGLNRYYDTVHNLKVSPTRTWIDANGNHGAVFYTGKAAMLIHLWGQSDVINKNAPEGFSYDAQMMPIGWSGERNCIYVPNQWVVYSKASDSSKEAAWLWIKHYLSEDSQNLIADSFGSIGFPVRKSALEKVSGMETVPEAFFKGIDECGVTLFECPTWAEWRPKAEQAFLEMIKGVISPEDAAKRVDGIVKDLLAE